MHLCGKTEVVVFKTRLGMGGIHHISGGGGDGFVRKGEQAQAE